ncbi:MAG: potassium channel family protein [Bacillota bacterium]
MWMLGTLASLLLILLVLVDGFEVILQPRRVMHRYRYARFYYNSIWSIWRTLALRIPAGRRRETFLSVFGPLSMLGLFATWVFGLVFGFALLHWSMSTPVHTPERWGTFPTYLYLSGTTFFTLGYGDVTPIASLGRALAVVESGLGFGFLAIIISYLPVLFQAFSRREMSISLMDARAGSPPNAAQVLLRVARSGSLAALNAFLVEWEQWAAELLESHLSFPVLSYYRSQHDNQSWLATLTAILDTSAFLIAEVKSSNTYQAQLTFAMARHAAVDLTLILKTPPRAVDHDRLPAPQLQRMRDLLREAGLDLHDAASGDAKLAELRAMYELFVNALARRFLFSLPPILPEGETADNWQRSAWMRRTPGIGSLPPPEIPDGSHFG